MQNIKKTWNIHENTKPKNNRKRRTRRIPAQRHRKYIQQIIEENFPYLKEDIPMKVQEAYRTLNRLGQKKSPHHMITKMQNIQNKERTLRVAKGKGQVKYKSRSILITPDFSMETMKARRFWVDVLQTLKDHGY